MKRALFWATYLPIGASMLVVSIIGMALTWIEAGYRGFTGMYDELLRRYEHWCFNYVPHWPDRHEPLVECFKREFSNTWMSR